MVADRGLFSGTDSRATECHFGGTSFCHRRLVCWHCAECDIGRLGGTAVAKACVMYKKVHSKIPANEIDDWAVEELLSNSGVMIEGELTRAVILLLGKPTAIFKLRPAVVEVKWTLCDAKKDVVDYEHFTAPFILTVDEILSKNRNLTMRELASGMLFPDIMKQYDDYSIREVLHNAICASVLYLLR